MGGIVECVIRKIAVVQCACSRRRLDLCRDTLGLTDSWLQFFAETGASHLMAAPDKTGDAHIGLCSKGRNFDGYVITEMNFKFKTDENKPSARPKDKPGAAAAGRFRSR